MQGTRADNVAYHKGRLYNLGVSLSSHFAVPNGAAVWLATFV